MTRIWRLAAAMVVTALLFTSEVPDRVGAADPAEAVGELPVAGGIALVLWNGGPLERLILVGAARGCAVRSAWVAVNGELLGHVPSAPTVVNAAFNAAYPRAVLPTNTALLLLCAPGAPVAPPVGSGALPLNVPMAVDAGVTPADEAFVRNGALAGQAYLASTFGGGLAGLNSIRVHADGAVTQELTAGVTSCCYTSPRSTHIFTGHPVWLGARGTLPAFGFDARVYVMAHEYGHLWQAEIGCASTRVPAWIVEGSAEYIGIEAAVRARLIAPDQRARFESAGAVLVPASVTLAAMEARDVLYTTSGAYALASLAVGQALVGQTPLALHDFCVDIAAGSTWQGAFTKRFGRSPEVFYTEFEAFRRTLR